MVSKIRKAIGAVKDRTSVALASAATGRAVVRATTHSERPPDPDRVDAVLQLASSTRAAAGACVSSLSRRLSRTRDSCVALKCLHLLHRLLRDGGPHFAREARPAARRLLNLSGFRDASGRRDHAAFARAFALYLEERLGCAAPGERPGDPEAALERIPRQQALLARAVGMAPEGSARTCLLVRACLQAVARETFDVYADVRDRVQLLLDEFFRLERKAAAYDACVAASRQAEDLAGFYEACRVAGALMWGEYPHVERVRAEILESLLEFLKAEQMQVEHKEDRKEDKPVPILLLRPPPRAPAAEEEVVNKSTEECDLQAAAGLEEDWQMMLMESAEEIARARAEDKEEVEEDGEERMVKAWLEAQERMVGNRWQLEVV